MKSETPVAQVKITDVYGGYATYDFDTFEDAVLKFAEAMVSPGWFSVPPAKVELRTPNIHSGRLVQVCKYTF